MQRTFILVLGVLLVFLVAAGVMMQLMPGPLKDSDYLVIGSVATLLALLVLFLGLTGARGKDGLFFKRRKKQG
jgi:hypothetical protein